MTVSGLYGGLGLLAQRLAVEEHRPEKELAPIQHRMAEEGHVWVQRLGKENATQCAVKVLHYPKTLQQQMHMFKILLVSFGLCNNLLF